MDGYIVQIPQANGHSAATSYFGHRRSGLSAAQAQSFPSSPSNK
jgi:hypothetical protein